MLDLTVGLGKSEENVWHLCKAVQQNKPELLKNSFVIFISNENKTVPFWYQKQGKVKNEYFIVWDYHVLFVIKGQKQAMLLLLLICFATFYFDGS